MVNNSFKKTKIPPYKRILSNSQVLCNQYIKNLVLLCYAGLDKTHEERMRMQDG